MFIEYIQIVTKAISECSTKQAFFKKCSQLVQERFPGATLQFSLEAEAKGEPQLSLSLEEFGVAIFSLPPGVLFSKEALETLRQLLLAALKQLHRLERVAAASRRANEERLALRQDEKVCIIAESAPMKALLEVSQ